MVVLRISWPSANGLTTHAATRRDLEGSVVRNAAGKMRHGVFPAHHNPLYTRRPDMRLDIPDFRAVQDKGGPAWIAGEGATTTPVFGAAPAANKRIDLLYLTQELPGIDPTTEVGFFVEPGIASPSPSLPALPAARADAIPWLSVEIPAGATSMQSAGVIIKELYPYTAMAGGTVVVRDLIELAAWTPADGSRAFCLDDTGEYARVGAAWRSAGSGLIADVAAANTSSALAVVGASFAAVTGAAALATDITVSSPTRVKVTLIATFSGNSGAVGQCAAIASGATTVAPVSDEPGLGKCLANDSAAVSTQIMTLNPGTTTLRAGYRVGASGVNFRNPKLIVETI